MLTVNIYSTEKHFVQNQNSLNTKFVFFFVYDFMYKKYQKRSTKKGG